MTEKVYCTGSGTNDFVGPRAYDDRSRFVQCQHCERILKAPKPGTPMRRHQVRGKSTASLDKTYEILWGGAT